MYTKNKEKAIEMNDNNKKNNNKFEHTYDNWYYEGNIQSDSIIKTKKYLDNFKNNQNLYVSFVFK